MDNVTSILSRIDGISSKDLSLYENFEGSFILANPEDMTVVDLDIFKSLLNDLCKNKIADAVLYTRLSQRLLTVADSIESHEEAPIKVEGPQEEVLEDLEFLSKALEEHSTEEFEFFKDILSIAMTMNLACGMDFNTLPPAASMKFQTTEDLVDFVQMRELQSIFKFYMLWQSITATPVFQDLDDETYVNFVSIVQNIISSELEHFEELKEYSDIGRDDFTQSKLQIVKNHAEKEI